jgi:hypothetical protein
VNLPSEVIFRDRATPVIEIETLETQFEPQRRAG